MDLRFQRRLLESVVQELRQGGPGWLEDFLWDVNLIGEHRRTRSYIPITEGTSSWRVSGNSSAGTSSMAS